MTNTFKIPASNLDKVKDFITGLNRKAVKYALAPILLTIGEAILSTFKDDNGLDKVKVSYPVSVSLPEVKINGYSFLASIEHAETGNLIKKGPSFYSFAIPEKYFAITPYCEHCKINRFRKDSFLLLHDNGEIKQVGRNCLADFLGHDVTNFLKIAEFSDFTNAMLTAESEESVNHHSSFDGWPLADYLAYVSLAIRSYGWVSRANAGYSVSATADSALMLLTDRQNTFRPSEEDINLASKALAWINAKTDLNNDYLINLSNAVKMGYATSKNVGFLASLIPAYKKELGLLESRKTIERPNPSNYYGAIGNKVTLELTYIKGISFDSQFGICWIHLFIDSIGNKFKWQTSSDLSKLLEDGSYQNFKMGDNLKLKGTIKTHSDYKGEKQTCLTRCKII